MNTYKEYTVILKGDIESLVDTVNRLTNKRWTPISGVSIANNSWYLQTMVK